MCPLLGNFHAGEAGAVLKRLDRREHAAYQRLMADPLTPFVPEFRGTTDKEGEPFLQVCGTLNQKHSSKLLPVWDIKVSLYSLSFDN